MTACTPQSCARGVPYLRLAVAIFVAAQTMTLSMAVSLDAPDRATLRWMHWGMLGGAAVVLGLLGVPLLLESLRQLRRGRVTMELLFVAGIAAAMGISCAAVVQDRPTVYFETVAVLLVVYSVGQAINARAQDRAALAAQALTSEAAVARRVDGALVDAATIRLGEQIRVLPGDVIPVDGRVVAGVSLVRQTVFTGQWRSVLCREGDAVLAGSAAEDGMLVVEATSGGADRRIDQLAALIDAARSQPTALQRQADRFVRWFLPITLLTAGAVLAFWWVRGDGSRGLMDALAVLLVACPCAAGLATPLATWTAMGWLARRGLVLHTGDAIERLSEVDSAIFDKTGTLGEEELALEELRVLAGDEERTLAVLRAIERCSEHPVARVLRGVWSAEQPPSAAGVQRDSQRLSGGPYERRPGEQQSGNGTVETTVAHAGGVEAVELRTVPGWGVAGRVLVDGAGHGFALGRTGDCSDDVITVELRLDGEVAARARIVEPVRASAGAAIRELRSMGLPVQVLTGGEGGSEIAPTLSGLTPQQKHAWIVEQHRRGDGCRPVFVGDGVNDAAAMAAAHASIALATGAPIAVQTASATLHGGDLRVVPLAIGVARRTRGIIRRSLVWAAAYNALGIALAVLGFLHPVTAGLLMAGSSAVIGWLCTRGDYESLRATSTLPCRTGVSGLRDSSQIGMSVPPEEGVQSLGFGVQRKRSASTPTLQHRKPETRHPKPEARSRACLLLHCFGLVAQAVVLCKIAGTSLPASATLVAVAVVGAAMIVRRAWVSPAAEMTLAMVSVGGLGMNLGWFADLCLNPAGACCGHGAGFSSWLTWMNAGMVGFGVPAMFMLRRDPEPFDLRRWCCGGMLVLGVPGMVVGMRLGSQLAAGLGIAIPSLAVLADYALMMVGMCAGMLVPHLAERMTALPKSRSQILESKI